MRKLVALLAALAIAAAVGFVVVQKAHGAGPAIVFTRAYVAINYDGTIDQNRSNGVTLTSGTDFGGNVWICLHMTTPPVTAAGIGTGGPVEIVLPGDNSPATDANGNPTTNDAYVFGAGGPCTGSQASYLERNMLGSKFYLQFLG